MAFEVMQLRRFRLPNSDKPLDIHQAINWNSSSWRPPSISTGGRRRHYHPGL